MRFLLRWRRVVIPLLLAPLCLLVATWVSPIPAWLLTMLSLGLMLDAGLALMPTTGGLSSHRQ